MPTLHHQTWDSVGEAHSRTTVSVPRARQVKVKVLFSLCNHAVHKQIIPTPVKANNGENVQHHKHERCGPEVSSRAKKGHPSNFEGFGGRTADKLPAGQCKGLDLTPAKVGSKPPDSIERSKD